MEYGLTSATVGSLGDLREGPNCSTNSVQSPASLASCPAHHASGNATTAPTTVAAPRASNSRSLDRTLVCSNGRPNRHVSMAHPKAISSVAAIIVSHRSTRTISPPATANRPRLHGTPLDCGRLSSARDRRRGRLSKVCTAGKYSNPVDRGRPRQAATGRRGAQMTLIDRSGASSHRGGHYKNSRTSDHYGHHKK